MNNNGDIMIYQTDDGLTKIQVDLHDGSVWLTANQMAQLFERNETTIRKHINNVFTDGELTKENNTQFLRVDGVKQPVAYYNLDVIISVGYRVKSIRGTQFRIWATERLKEYMIKGFTLDDERMKQLGGGGYWKELLDRIRDIRSSEKVMYRQVLDLYATSVDYDPRSEESIRFFKIVQNKLHYAAHGHTAPEIIYERADATKPFMGLKTFKGEIPVLQDVRIAKNYLDENELKILNNIVSGYFDFAEVQAMRHNAMHMSDYIEHLDKILSSTGEKMLKGAGTVSHKRAMEKAEQEYRKYQVQTLSPVETAYLETIKETERLAKKKSRE